MESSTKQFRKRNAILSFLRQTDTHPSAEMVFNHLKSEYPDLSLGTVYRNLSMFKNQGEIVSIGTVNGVERFDGNTKPHVHFICDRCSKVQDLHQLEVPTALCQSAARETGASVSQCWLTFRGECSDCKSIPHQ